MGKNPIRLDGCSAKDLTPQETQGGTGVTNPDGKEGARQPAPQMRLQSQPARQPGRDMAEDHPEKTPEQIPQEAPGPRHRAAGPISRNQVGAIDVGQKGCQQGGRERRITGCIGHQGMANHGQAGPEGRSFTLWALLPEHLHCGHFGSNFLGSFGCPVRAAVIHHQDLEVRLAFLEELDPFPDQPLDVGLHIQGQKHQAQRLCGDRG
jgi:hypothetical protein